MDICELRRLRAFENASLAGWWSLPGRFKVELSTQANPDMIRGTHVLQGSTLSFRGCVRAFNEATPQRVEIVVGDALKVTLRENDVRWIYTEEVDGDLRLVWVNANKRP